MDDAVFRQGTDSNSPGCGESGRGTGNVLGKSLPRIRRAGAGALSGKRGGAGRHGSASEPFRAVYPKGVSQNRAAGRAD